MARHIQNQNQNTNQSRNIGPTTRIYQLNIEGSSKSKSENLSRQLKDNNIDIAVIQETHISSEEALFTRGEVPGYEIIGATLHKSYGTATYVKYGLENVKLVETSSLDNISVVTIELGGTNIVNVYKPPNEVWPANVLPSYDKPSIYIGDFNSHHSLWKYRDDDDNGVAIVNWTQQQNLHLLFDAKDIGTFQSGRWRRDYNPDLCSFHQTRMVNRSMHQEKY